MSYLVYALGAFLSLCGATAFYSGYGIIEVERGWAMVIAGSVAFSAGLVIVALGLILHELARLEALWATAPRRALRARRAFAGDRRDEFLASPEAFGPGSEPAALVPPAPAGRGWPARSARSGLSAARNLIKTRGAVVPRGRPATPSEGAPLEPSLDRPAAPEGQQEEPWGEGPDLRQGQEEKQERLAQPQVPFKEQGGRAIKEEPSVEPPIAEPAAPNLQPAEPSAKPYIEVATPTASLSPNFEEELFIELRRAQEAILGRSEPPVPDQNEKPEMAHDESGALPPLSSNAQELAVVGQYDTQGTSYVMYSDGSVEARTQRAVFHFRSMAELKAFLESDGQLPQE